MHRRSKNRINYQLFNSTGEKVSLHQPNSNHINSIQHINQGEMANSNAEVLILMEEVDDLIDENPLDKVSIEDTAIIVSKLDQKRSTLRKLVFGKKSTETDDEHEKLSAMVLPSLPQ